MASLNTDFGRLLKMAVNGIAIYEGKNAPIVEDELGQQIGVVYTTIQRYKAGHMPPDPRTIVIFAEAGVKRGRLSREWLQEFLHASSYPAPDKLIDRLCPSTQMRSRPPRVYENLPAPTYSQFIMREEAFALVIDGLQQRSATVLIVGLGGNGKTSLAREIAACCLKEGRDGFQFDAAVWVSDKDRPGTTTLSSMLDAIARTLGYPGFAELAHDEKLREVGQLLRQQRVLLVVDNFETIADRALVDWLLRLPEPSKALVTSREKQRAFWSSWLIELRGMSEAEAQALVTQRLRMLRLDKWGSDSTQFEPLISVTGGNPKAIEMALGIVKHEHRPLQQVVDDLHAARGALFDDLFSRAWSLLDGAEQRILLATTFFPSNASAEALAATAEVHGFAFDRALERLTDLSLLDVQQFDLVSVPRYTLHPLVRAFAVGKLAEQPAFEAQARSCWSAYYIDFLNRYVVRTKPAERYWNCLAGRNLPVLEPEWDNLLNVLEWAEQQDQHALLLELMIRLAHPMDRRGRYTERIHFAKKAANAADLLGGRREAALLRDEALLRIDALGYTLIEEQRFEEAEQEITIGLERVHLLNSESPDAHDLTALAYALLGRLNLQRGQVARAAEWIARIQTEACQAVIRYRVAMASGELAQAQQRYPTAIALFKEMARIQDEYGGEESVQDDIGQLLGFAYLASGELEQAKTGFNNVLTLKENAGTIEAIWCIYGLACVAVEEGDQRTAYQLAHHAQDALVRLKIWHRLHQRIRQLLAHLEAGTEAETALVEYPSPHVMHREIHAERGTIDQAEGTTLAQMQGSDG